MISACDWPQPVWKHCIQYSQYPSVAHAMCIGRKPDTVTQWSGRHLGRKWLSARRISIIVCAKKHSAWPVNDGQPHSSKSESVAKPLACRNGEMIAYRRKKSENSKLLAAKCGVTQCISILVSGSIEERTRRRRAHRWRKAWPENSIEN